MEMEENKPQSNGLYLQTLEHLVPNDGLSHIFFELRGVRSIRRAIRRGRIAEATLTLAPKRPFNNRRNTSRRGKGVHSRNMNIAKQRLYAEFKRNLSKQSV